MFLLFSAFLFSCNGSEEEVILKSLNNKANAKISSDITFYNIPKDPYVSLSPSPSYTGVKSSYADLSQWIKSNSSFNVNVTNHPDSTVSNPIFWVGDNWDIFRQQSSNFVLVYDGNSLTDVLDRFEYIRINGTTAHQEAATKGWVVWSQPF